MSELPNSNKPFDTDNDPFDLTRFVNAQKTVYPTVLSELRSGQKQSHWMWFIFPQIAGLGFSSTAQHYGTARANLEAQGKSLAPLDMQIGSHALSLPAILVTNDQAFHHMTGLQIEDWTV